ncbi:glycerate kinase, partial [Escherichia coli]|nr:glycerate kinase [Escherichia coli]
GTGMLSALGVKFTDVNGDLLQMNGANLAHIAQIDITNLDSRLKEVTFKVPVMFQILYWVKMVLPIFMVLKKALMQR